MKKEETNESIENISESESVSRPQYEGSTFLICERCKQLYQINFDQNIISDHGCQEAQKYLMRDE